MRIRTTSRQRANFRLIEIELYNYHDTKREMEELRQDILDETAKPELGVSVQSGPGNVTQSKVIRLQTSRELIELQKRINAIEYALNVFRLEPEPRKSMLVEMKYFKREKTDYGISRELCVSEETFRNWRREFIRLVSERLGWEI